MGDARIESQKRQNARHACRLIKSETGTDVWLGGSGIVWYEWNVLIHDIREMPFEDVENIKEYIETEMAIMALKHGGPGRGPPFL